MMRKIKILIALFAVVCTISVTYAFYSTKTNMSNVFKTEGYTFKINATGGTFSENNVVVENGTTTLPSPDRLGYTFLGYSTTKDGDVDYTNFIDNVEKINNITIYAKWQTNIYSISYDLNGGSISNPKNDYTVEESFTLPTPTKDSYTFIGWTGSNGSTPEKNIRIPKGTTGELAYTANWQAVDYNITYFLNGGSISGQRTSYNIETETFTLPKPTRSGYNFSGWTGSNGNTMQQDVTIYKGSSGNKSYNANWNTVNYNISYNYNNGWANNPSSYNVETNTFTLNNPTRNGYVFDGWTGTGLSGKTGNVTIYKGTVGDRSYTAQWHKYNATDAGGIHLTSLRNGVWWAYNLDGYYSPGDNTVAGNWTVVVDNYCVYITGTKKPTTAFSYSFTVRARNDENNILGTGTGYAPGDGVTPARATICW